MHSQNTEWHSTLVFHAFFVSGGREGRSSPARLFSEPRRDASKLTAERRLGSRRIAAVRVTSRKVRRRVSAPAFRYHGSRNRHQKGLTIASCCLPVIRFPRSREQGNWNIQRRYFRCSNRVFSRVWPIYALGRLQCLAANTHRPQLVSTSHMIPMRLEFHTLTTEPDILSCTR